MRLVPPAAEALERPEAREQKAPHRRAGAGRMLGRPGGLSRRRVVRTLRGEAEGEALEGPGLAALLERGAVQLLVESQGLRHRRLLARRGIEALRDLAIQAPAAWSPAAARRWRSRVARMAWMGGGEAGRAPPSKLTLWQGPLRGNRSGRRHSRSGGRGALTGHGVRLASAHGCLAAQFSSKRAAAAQAVLESSATLKVRRNCLSSTSKRNLGERLCPIPRGSERTRPPKPSSLFYRASCTETRPPKQGIAAMACTMLSLPPGNPRHSPIGIDSG